ncbi:MAG: N-acetyl-alpha-D-glucosaminyl L-malate synthase BshA [Bacteroidota bacterium]|nr:N-acetyl-alpha-D-glucosaminyl L-malate synthase BshA [Bacteroidota bacterium]
MKIGITCYPTFGGSGVVATELGLALADRGHEVHFVTYDRPFRLDHFHDRVYFHGVEMAKYPLFEFDMYTLALTSKLVEVTQYQELDILHMHYAIPHAVSAYLARQILGKGNIKTVTTLHGTDSTLVGLEPSFLPLMRFALENSDGVTAVSRFLRDKTVATYQLDKDIETIPNFIDSEAYAPRESCQYKELFAPNGEKVMVHTSNFRPVKRVPDVIRTFATVRAQLPAKLILIGDGPERSESETLCRELNILEDVRFLGKQDALVDILAASDLFILPSQSESFGLSALEAMSCGLPVISTSIGGIPEVNLHAETGYIAEIGDTDRMARYAVELFTNEAKYAAFSRAARRRAVEVYDKEKIVPLYEDFYRRILDAG